MPGARFAPCVLQSLAYRSALDGEQGERALSSDSREIEEKEVVRHLKQCAHKFNLLGREQ